MLELVSIYFFLACYSFALYGWGRATEYILRIRWPWPMTICLGLAMVILVGGVCVSLQIAYAITLDVLAGIGLALASISTWKSINNRGLSGTGTSPLSTGPLCRGDLLGVIPAVFLIIAAISVTAIYLVPPQNFNLHDDFETYFSLPLRLLDTGTLKPGMFTNFGVNTLGGQSFLHAFIAAHWPITYINAVDALFGLALCATIILIAGRRTGLAGSLTLLAVAFIIVISPQYVNVSTIYLGSALLIFLTLIPLGVRKDGSPIKLVSTVSAITIGIIYAAIVALKSTFVLPIFVHFILLLIAVTIATRSIRKTVLWSIKVAVTSLVCISPWLQNQFYRIPPDFLTRAATPDNAVNSNLPVNPAEQLDLFSTEPLYYGFGASYFLYTSLIILVCLCGGFIARQAHQGERLRDPRTLWAITACILLPAFFTLHTLIIGGFVMGHESSLRYAVPIIIALAPVALIYAGSNYLGNQNSMSLRQPLRSGRRILLGGISALLVISFMGSVTDRINQARSFGSVLSIGQEAKHPIFLGYNRFALEGNIKDEIRKIQYLVPAGKPILSSINLSFHLDFHRNPILDVQPGGLGSPLQRFPFSGTDDNAALFFRQNDIEYVLWQHRGVALRSQETLQTGTRSAFAAARTNAINTLKFYEILRRLGLQSELLYDGGGYVLFRLL